MQMYIKGGSTRKVKDITEKLCGINFSKSHISQITKNLDEEITVWRNRPLVKEYPYLIVDALYEKIRIQKKRISQGVLIVVGVGEDGYREILAVDIANTKNKGILARVFQHLKQKRW